MRILFMGSGEIALPAFRQLVQSEHEIVGLVTQPDKPVGRHQNRTASAIKQAALTANLPIFQPEKVRAEEIQSSLSALCPDFIVVMAYGQILPRALLELPTIACLNLHASLLPRHRGASPIQSALLAGDLETGITLMHMDIGLDTGDIVISHKIPILKDDTAENIHDKLALLAPEVLMEGLQLFGKNAAPRSPQDPACVTVSKKLDRDSGKIDWTLPADVIERHIRAMHSWPGAFTLLPLGKKLKVHRGEVTFDSGQPGEILRADNQLIIATGHNALRLDEVQLEGRSRIAAADFLRGYPLKLHEILPFRA